MKLFITGDYCPIGRIGKQIEAEKYENIFSAISEYSQQADIAIANLEAPLTESTMPIVKSGPNIKGSKKALIPLVDAGFDTVTLANNHILDYGEKGIEDTVIECEKSKLSYVGVGQNLSKARNFLIKEVKGKKIAILNFAENEFCVATENSFGANPINPITNFTDIQKAKQESDFVLVVVHGGREHYQLPTPKQRERYRFYVDAGADLILGHHTHCFSGYEKYNEKYIFYSLGNFVFDYKEKYQKGLWTQGIGVDFDIDLETKSVKFNLVPFNQGRKENPFLSLLENEDKAIFDKKIEELNAIIVDDKKFNDEWNKYIDSQNKGYLSLLFIDNMYIRALITRGFLPKIFFKSNTRKALLLNLFRCETHKEIMESILSKELK